MKERVDIPQTLQRMPEGMGNVLLLRPAEKRDIEHGS